MWTQKDIEKVERYLKSKRGISNLKKLNDVLERQREENEQCRRDEIAWWHNIKDKPFTI